MPFIIHWVDNCEGPEETAGIDTPAGKLKLFLRGDVITGMDWDPGDDSIPCGERHPLQEEWNRLWTRADHAIPVKLLKQGSAYRNKVWAELCKIPIGETATYSFLARTIHSSARAVGNACRDNPYPLIVPCHRVVSVNGLGGYSGQTEGDLMAIKIKLLRIEADLSRERRQPD